jgi:hypothetical protein
LLDDAEEGREGVLPRPPYEGPAVPPGAACTEKRGVAGVSIGDCSLLARTDDDDVRRKNGMEDGVSRLEPVLGGTRPLAGAMGVALVLERESGDAVIAVWIDSGVCGLLVDPVASNHGAAGLTGASTSATSDAGIREGDMVCDE